MRAIFRFRQTQVDWSVGAGGWGQFSSDGWVNFLAMSAEDAEEKLLREMAL